MTLHSLLAALLLVLAPLASAQDAPASAVDQRWSAERANAWYDEVGWVVGSNFAPSTAINQLEMWQAETFDPEAIDRELGLAESLGFNSMRVFLHDLLWQQDPEGFLDRIDQYLTIADRHGIRTMLVLFDGVWDPNPHLGPQRAPKPHLHNSGWVQSPGAAVLADTTRHAELESYVKGVISRFRDDRRVLIWDLFNEPDNENRQSYFAYEPVNKAALAGRLLEKAFGWAREANPSQPLTAAPWRDWEALARGEGIGALMLWHSDVVTFHSYDPLAAVETRVQMLQALGRPVLCTEYMARPTGSTFEAILPYFAAQEVGAYNWGFVEGRSQTIYPWDSWDRAYASEPAVWFHDIFRNDGTPYRADEVALIRSLTTSR